MKWFPWTPTRTLLSLAILALILLSLFTHPVPIKDTLDYLGFMRGFLREGLRYNLNREPGYPLFLAGIARGGMDPERWIPLLQNLLFVGSLYCFLRTLLAARLSREKTLLAAVGITLLPTFAIAMNGAIMTESLNASLIFLYLACCTRLYFALMRGRGAALPAAGALATSLALALVKASFIYIDLAFPLVAAVMLWWWRTRLRPTRRALAWTLVLLAIGATGRLTMSAWLGLHNAEGVFSQRAYLRGGAMLYGRVLYARDFDFAHDVPGFLLEGFSDSACHRLLGARCDQYGSAAEEARGTALHEINLRGGYNDAQLMAMGEREVLHHPAKQIAFIPLELSRYVFHHTMKGFGRLDFPVLGRALQSSAFAVLLKLLNLALYLFVPAMWLASRRRGVDLGARIEQVSDAELVGAVLALAYIASLLAVYSFVPAAVRMVYPVAPLLVVLNWQAWRFFRAAEAAPAPDARRAKSAEAGGRGKR